MREDDLMDIHKPKPIHNWREFLKELGTIALGVGIALAAEQGVEWFHWRTQVAQARDVIANELASNLVGAISRVRTKNCAEERLASLALTLDEAAKKGSLPPVGDFNLPPRSIWPTGAWDSVVASQTATHFPRQQLAAIAASYKFIQRIEYYSGQEVDAWNSLYPMAGPGRRLDPASEAELRKALSLSLADARIMSTLSEQLMASVQGQHLPFTREDLDRIAAEEHRNLDEYSICRPVGAVPPSYGQAYNTTAMARVDATAKNLPDFSKSAP